MADLVELAKEWCIEHHGNATRRGSDELFHTHPFAVAEILARNGYTDPKTQAAAYLHDLVEDTDVTIRQIERAFGFDVANMVFIMSRNTITDRTTEDIRRALRGDVGHWTPNEIYKLRFAFATDDTQRLKIADNIHNTRTLSTLSSYGQMRYVHDARGFWIPIGQRIAPIMIRELVHNIAVYEAKQDAARQA